MSSDGQLNKIEPNPHDGIFLGHKMNSMLICAAPLVDPENPLASGRRQTQKSCADCVRSHNRGRKVAAGGVGRTLSDEGLASRICKEDSRSH